MNLERLEHERDEEIRAMMDAKPNGRGLTPAKAVKRINRQRRFYALPRLTAQAAAGRFSMISAEVEG